jgi:hypothetical protein
MNLFHRPTETPSDEQIDGALRDLFAATSRPGPRPGFERRLQRAIARSAAAERRTRRLRLLMGSYWAIAAAASTAIVWRLLASLISGPGLWLALGGMAIVIGSGISLALLGFLPMKRGGRSRFAGL